MAPWLDCQLLDFVTCQHCHMYLVDWLLQTILSPEFLAALYASCLMLVSLVPSNLSCRIWCCRSRDTIFWWLLWAPYIVSWEALHRSGTWSSMFISYIRMLSINLYNNSLHNRSNKMQESGHTLSASHKARTQPTRHSKCYTAASSKSTRLAKSNQRTRSAEI